MGSKMDSRTRRLNEIHYSAGIVMSGKDSSLRIVYLLQKLAQLCRLQQPVREGARWRTDRLPRGLVRAGCSLCFMTRGTSQMAEVGEVVKQGLEALEHGRAAVTMWEGSIMLGIPRWSEIKSWKVVRLPLSSTPFEGRIAKIVVQSSVTNLSRRVTSKRQISGTVIGMIWVQGEGM